jgi:hypothetical protein
MKLKYLLMKRNMLRTNGILTNLTFEIELFESQFHVILLLPHYKWKTLVVF